MRFANGPVANAHPDPPEPCQTMLDKQLLKRIFDLTRPYRRTLVIAIGCMIAAGLLKPCQAYLIKPLLDKIF